MRLNTKHIESLNQVEKYLNTTNSFESLSGRSRARRIEIAEKLISYPKKIGHLTGSITEYLITPFFGSIAVLLGGKFFQKSIIPQEIPDLKPDKLITQFREEIRLLLIRVDKDEFQGLKGRKELFEIVLDWGTRWTGFSSANLYLFDDDTCNLKFHSHKNHPQRSDGIAWDAAVALGEGIGKVIGIPSNYKMTPEQYEELKKRGDGSHGSIFRAIYEGKPYFVPDQKNVPSDVPLGRFERALIAFSNPQASAGIPIGYSEKEKYAKGIFIVTNQTKGEDIFHKGKILYALADLFALILEKKDMPSEDFKSSISNKIVEVFFAKAQESSEEIVRAYKKMHAFGGGGINAGKEGRLIHGVFQFSDFVRFTRVSQVLKPREVPELINRYIAAATYAINQFAGSIDKYIGDAVMSYIQNTLNLNDHSDYFPAELMQKEIRPLDQAILSALWAKATFYYADQFFSNTDVSFKRIMLKADSRLGFKISMASGEAVFGNVGNGQRLNYTALGKPVNRSARILDKTPRNNIMYDQETFDLLSSKTAISPETTPFTWHVIQSNLLMSGFREVLNNNPRIGYYDLVLKTMQHYSSDYWFKYNSVDDILFKKDVSLKGITEGNDTVAIRGEAWDRRKPVAAANVFSDIFQYRNSKPDFFKSEFLELLKEIETDHVTVAAFEAYLNSLRNPSSPFIKLEPYLQVLRKASCGSADSKKVSPEQDAPHEIARIKDDLHIQLLSLNSPKITPKTFFTREGH
jgi:class 3 adenylate cyclase